MPVPSGFMAEQSTQSGPPSGFVPEGPTLEQPSLWDRTIGKVKSYLTPDKVPDGSGYLPTTMNNITKRVGSNMVGLVDSGVQGASHLIKSMGGNEQESQKLEDGLNSIGPAGMGALTDQVKGYVNEPDSQRRTENILGDISTGVLLHQAPEVISGGLRSAGDLLETGGRKVGGATIGTSPADRAFNTRPGAGISQNRIVAATRAGLLDKVKGKIDPLTAQRDTVLSQSPVTGMDIRRDVNEPFHQIRTVKSDPITGGAEPKGLANLSLMQKVANMPQDPITGQPIPGQVKPLGSVTPLQAAKLNSNLRDMATYSGTQPEGTLAEQALKGAGSNIRQSIANASPESAPITQQLHDTLGARDILQRQMKAVDSAPPTSTTLAGAAGHYIADPARVAIGSTLASGMDALGGGMKSLANKLSPASRQVGPPPANYGITSSGPQPPPAGLLPQFAGQQAGEPPIAPTTSTPNPASPVPYPNLVDEPAQLPSSATPGFTSPVPKPPPSVSLKERVTAQPERGLTPQPAPPLHGTSGPGRTPVPTLGPEGPGQFQSSPRRLAWPSPKPAYGITPQISPDALINEAQKGGLLDKVKAGGLIRDAAKLKEAESAIQEPSTGGVLQHAQGDVGGQGSERGGVESSQQGEKLAEKVKRKGNPLTEKVTYYGNKPVVITGDALLDQHAEFPHVQEWIKQQRRLGQTDAQISKSIDMENSAESSKSDDARFDTELDSIPKMNIVKPKKSRVQ